METVVWWTAVLLTIQTYLLNGSCLSCNSTCTTCLNSSFCTNCSQNYLLSNNICLLDCSKIKNGTFLSNGQCKSCGTNCQTCLNVSQCSSCNSPFFLDGGACLPNCSIISNSTYLLNRTCERCPIGCASCYNQSYCTTCKSNYTLLANNSCDPNCTLNINCSACIILPSAIIYCTKCTQGYFTSSGICKPSCGDGYFIGAE